MSHEHDHLKAKELGYLLTCALPAGALGLWRVAGVPEVMGCFGVPALALVCFYAVAGVLLLIEGRRLRGAWSVSMLIGVAPNVGLLVFSVGRLVVVWS